MFNQGISGDQAGSEASAGVMILTSLKPVTVSYTHLRAHETQ